MPRAGASGSDALVVQFFGDGARARNTCAPDTLNYPVEIHALAEKLVSCALAGEGWALKEIGDRLAGKPMQPVEHSGDDDRNIEQFSDAELTAILRSRVKIVPVETTDEERPEGEPLN
jgi:hypothetical protein